MSTSITLKEALRSWEETYLRPESLLPHLSDEEIDIFQIQDKKARRKAVEHLARCAKCADRYRERQRMQAIAAVQSWTVIYRKAAAGGEKVYPVVYFSEDGKYRIEILQSSNGGASGLIILVIEDSAMAAQHEGREYSVTDASGHLLLRGKILNGKVLQKVNDLEQIDDRNFLIRPLDPAYPN